MLVEILGAIASLAAEPQSRLLTSPCEFGEAYQYTTAHCTAEFTNPTDKPIKVIRAEAVKAGDRIAPSSATIAAKSTAYFEVDVAVEHDLGQSEHWFYVTTDDHAKRYTKASGFALSMLENPAPEIDFGAVDSDSKEVPTKTLTLSSEEAANFSVAAPAKGNLHVDASVDPDHRTVTLRLKKDLPWGVLNDYVVLDTNAAVQPRVAIHIKADVHGAVVPAENPFPMGLMRKGDNNEVLIQLRSRTGKDFKVGKITVDGLKAAGAVMPCRPLQEGCKLLRLAISDDQPTGMAFGTIHVDLPDFRRTLPILVSGTLIKHDAKIRELGKEAEGKAGRSVESSESSPIDVNAALRKATRKADVGAPAGSGPLLKWNVAHEELVHGYFIYRGDAESGPFVRVNKETIHPAGDDPESMYQWRDTSAVPGRTYWYYIGLVHTNGTREKLTEPQKVVAK